MEKNKLFFKACDFPVTRGRLSTDGVLSADEAAFFANDKRDIELIQLKKENRRLRILLSSIRRTKEKK